MSLHAKSSIYKKESRMTLCKTKNLTF